MTKSKKYAMNLQLADKKQFRTEFQLYFKYEDFLCQTFTTHCR
jgi:hypothetical protein